MLQRRYNGLRFTRYNINVTRLKHFLQTVFTPF